MFASYDDITKLSNVLQQNRNQEVQEDSDVSSVDSSELVIDYTDIHTSSSDSIVLNNCNDPLIKQALVLNVKKRQALNDVIKKLQDRLLQVSHVRNECRLRLCNEGKLYSKRENKLKKRLGTPYFKDINAFPSPPNLDWIEMKENKQLQENQIIRMYWSQEDKCNLLRGVFNAVCLKKIEELTHFIQCNTPTHKFYDKLVEEKNIFSNTELLKNLLEKWHNISFLDTLSSEEKLIVNTVIHWDEKLDWFQISSHFLEGRHSDGECEAMWNCYINPKYSKENWTKHDENLLVKLCEEYKYQNWETVAQKLPICRSAYQCCVHFHANLCEKFNRDRWTPEEDTYLQKTIENCTTGNYISWGRVAYYFNHRNKRQIYRHYNACGGKNIKKGNFSVEEDILLLTLVNLYNDNMRKISLYFPNRMITQLRKRINTLSMDVGRPWSIQEDSSIIAHVAKHGQKNWKLLKEVNRTEDCIRHRCKIIYNFFEMNPGSTVFEIPRRNGSVYRGNIRKRIRFVKKLVNDMINKLQINFNEEILSLEYIRKNLKPYLKNLEQIPKLKKNLPPTNINNILQQFFLSSYKCVLRTPIIFTEQLIQESADRIESLLRMLEANVTFPSLDEIDLHPDLDNLDKSIIKRIVTNNEKQNLNLQKSLIPSIKCIPPSIENLIGFRGILLHMKTLKLHARGKYEGYSVYCKTEPHCKYTQRGYFHNKSVLENMFTKSTDEIKQKVMRNEQLFIKRLRILFQWAYVVADTQAKPNIKLIVEEKEKQKPGPKKKEQKLYKIQLMNQARRQAAAERRLIRETTDCDNPSKKIKLN